MIIAAFDVGLVHLCREASSNPLLATGCEDRNYKWTDKRQLLCQPKGLTRIIEKHTRCDWLLTFMSIISLLKSHSNYFAMRDLIKPANFKRLLSNAPILATLAISAVLMAPFVENTFAKAYAETAHSFVLKFSISGPSVAGDKTIRIVGQAQQSGSKIEFKVISADIGGDDLKNVQISQSGPKAVAITGGDYVDTDNDFAHLRLIKLVFDKNLPKLDSSKTTFPVQLDLSSSTVAKAVEEFPDCDTDDPCPPSKLGDPESAPLDHTVTSPDSPTLEIDA
jgi:hypothetical protein